MITINYKFYFILFSEEMRRIPESETSEIETSTELGPVEEITDKLEHWRFHFKEINVYKYVVT